MLLNHEMDYKFQCLLVSEVSTPSLQATKDNPRTVCQTHITCSLKNHAEFISKPSLLTIMHNGISLFSTQYQKDTFVHAALNHALLA